MYFPCSLSLLSLPSFVSNVSNNLNVCSSLPWSPSVFHSYPYPHLYLMYLKSKYVLLALLLSFTLIPPHFLPFWHDNKRMIFCLLGRWPVMWCLLTPMKTAIYVWWLGFEFLLNVFFFIYMNIRSLLDNKIVQLACIVSIFFRTSVNLEKKEGQNNDEDHTAFP